MQPSAKAEGKCVGGRGRPRLGTARARALRALRSRLRTGGDFHPCWCRRGMGLAHRRHDGRHPCPL